MNHDSRLTGRAMPHGANTAWTYNARGWARSPGEPTPPFDLDDPDCEGECHWDL